MNDLISRQAAVDVATKQVMEWDGLYLQNLNIMIRNAIFNLPPAEPEHRWIPCVEKSPPDGVDVLITDATFFDGSIIAVAKLEDGVWKWRDDMSTSAEPHPVAWMSLPKPWEGE